MNSKKKLIIALCSLCIIAVVAVVSVVAVMAAVNTTVTSGITVTYTAYNVKATIAGEYTIGTGSATSMGTALTFTGSEKTTGGENQKSFAALTNLKLKSGEDLVLHYTITNTSTSDAAVPFSVSLTEPEAPTNMTIKYGTTLAGATSDTYTDVASLGAAGVTHVYVVFHVIDDTANATFNGSFVFNLEAIED